MDAPCISEDRASTAREAQVSSLGRPGRGQKLSSLEGQTEGSKIILQSPLFLDSKSANENKRLLPPPFALSLP